jgi:hypothetical protein
MNSRDVLGVKNDRVDRFPRVARRVPDLPEGLTTAERFREIARRVLTASPEEVADTNR